MADSLLKKKKKDEVPEFSWVGDPGAGASGRRLSGDDTKAMLQYNRDLVAPMDRGGGQNIRVNGQPARLAGSAPRTAPTWQQPLDRAGIARITSRYGNGQQPIVSGPANPNLGPAGPTVSYVGGPPEATIPPIASPPTPAVNAYATEDGGFEDSRTPGVQRNPDGSIAIPTIPANPNLTPIQPGAAPVNPAFAGGGDRLTGQTNFGQTGEELGGGGPGSVVNPSTGAPIPNANPSALANWLDKGGSAATFHRAQVAQGIRAPIDAHSAPDPQGSTAGSEIRASHGWGATNEGDAVSIAKQMTGEFNQNNAKSQAIWGQKFTDAHAKLMESLNNN